MSLPRFLSRVVDAAVPALGGLDRRAVEAKLEGTSVTLVTGAVDDAGRVGFLLAANLIARLYPSIVVIAPEDLATAAASEIVLINPLADVTTGGATTDCETTARLYFDQGAPAGDEERSVSVFARGWNVYVDDPPDDDGRASPAAALIAAVAGVCEVFRIVFADDLGDRGRRARQPGAFNLITLGVPEELVVPDVVELGEVRLVGAGAIGQAAAFALAASRARGTLFAVDHEPVELSNLQRYVLTRDSDVGATKVDLLRKRLANSGLEVVPLRTEWYAGLVEAPLRTLVALDSPESRIGVQASLPGPIYNAWTQPADIGWSRHEHFGDQPCLACLYWPQGERPSRHEQVAEAFRQHPLRVLAYLVLGQPVGLPLPPGGVPTLPDIPSPPEAPEWIDRPLLDDLAVAAGVDVADLSVWRDRPLADLYQEGVCGGALLHLDVGVAPGDVLVPLAHQSVFAGVMLAVELLAACVPELASRRPQAIEGRFDVLVGLPQVIQRPRARTEPCFCGDAVWLDVYRDRFGVEADEVA